MPEQSLRECRWVVGIGGDDLEREADFGRRDSSARRVRRPARRRVRRRRPRRAAGDGGHDSECRSARRREVAIVRPLRSEGSRRPKAQSSDELPIGSPGGSLGATRVDGVGAAGRARYRPISAVTAEKCAFSSGSSATSWSMRCRRSASAPSARDRTQPAAATLPDRSIRRSTSTRCTTRAISASRGSSSALSRKTLSTRAESNSVKSGCVEFRR